MPNVALLFPGQGAQSVGMGSQLLQRSQTARDLFESASDLLNYDLQQLCAQGPESKLNATEFSQPALFVHSMASLADLIQKKPDVMADVTAVAGLSLGEYSAICAAGGFSFEAGVRLVQTRGLAMQAAAESQSSGMASVLGLTVEQVAKLCDDARQDGQILQIANLLCPGNIAISGHVASLDQAEALSANAGAMKFIRLNVAGAFHTSIMQPAVAPLTQAILQADIRPTRFPLFANVDAQAHVQPQDFIRLLPQQVISPVQWESTLRNLLQTGVDQFYEIGAGRVLAGTLKRIDRKIPCECVGD